MKGVLNIPTKHTGTLIDFLGVHPYKWVTNMSTPSKRKSDRKPVLLTKQEIFVVVIGDGKITVMGKIMVVVSIFLDRSIENTTLY